MPRLPKVVQALLNPQIYPESAPAVEMVQTQMSFVFLAGDYVYKIKKPVNLGYLDYTTLSQRHFYCQREVELNQRLCPDTYLGLVPITRNRGDILLDGGGRVIEYAVKMRYLPQDRMMNVLLVKKQVSAAMVAQVAQKLAAFHQQAATDATISAFGELDAIRVNTEENFSQTLPYIGNTISEAQYRHIKDYTNSFIANNAPLFARRVAEGKIRDCHGDLHAAHICFTPSINSLSRSSVQAGQADDICIYDCIEFNDRFRYCDVASEIAFLAMDLDHYGRLDLSRSFVEAYVSSSRDKELLQLLSFYKCYRAYVRGKVEGFKLDDPHISDEEKIKILAVARSYFELAEGYV